MKRFALLVAAAILVSGCSLLTGPNRFGKVLSSKDVSDYAVFEGALTTEARTVTAEIGGETQVVGVVIGVTPPGGTERTVYCPRGKLADTCNQIPAAARVSVSGRPLGALAVLPENVRWLSD